MQKPRQRLAVLAVAACAMVAGILFVRWVHAVRIDVKQTLCVHNLKIAATALQRYAADHHGNFPDRFSQLYPAYLTETEILFCPLAESRPLDVEAISLETLDALSSYVLVPGLRIDEDPNTLLAYEKDDNHHGRGHSVLYVDGRGGWDPPEAWRDGRRPADHPEERH